ncbi:tRNA lysidine(34) synthetase TilS [Candidatus Amoebophilus asiaticus]|nr:tRNA lysidine(34) synthetase TilS [Candidatus Amoebophilus asiaticus]
MIDRFRSHIEKENLFQPKERILLAVSGGVDSVVMCDLFHQVNYDFSIAHCNFKLRGKESDADEKFVKKLARRCKVEFHVNSFKTEEFAKKEKISIQMAARILRYNWLTKIRLKDNYNYIATGHHQNDVIETVLLNLIRGTGIAGLHGILPKRDEIIRPLLFANKEDINEYAYVHHIFFREDSSNQSSKYLRNKLRHEVIPVLMEINPALEETMKASVERVREIEALFNRVVEDTINELLEVKKEGIYIHIDRIKKLNPLQTLLFEVLNKFNFSRSVVAEIIETLDVQSGKLFYSATHRIIKDRQYLIINERSNKQQVTGVIKSNQESFDNKEIHLAIKKLPNKNYKIPLENTTASLDMNKLKFPLKIRKWEEGDWFYPFGMGCRKKLSDFFIDNKFPINRKENTWVLISDQSIVWIAGHRIDERFKVTANTKDVLVVELLSC